MQTRKIIALKRIANDMKELVKRFKAFYKKELKEDFPQDTNVQL